MLESLKQEDLQFQELSPEEKQSRGILARLTGPIASFTKGTRNGRKYSDKLWEKAFDSPLVKEMFKNGGLPGELQHPADRSETDPTKIAIMMPEPPKKDSNGHLVASVDILDTPCGQIAYQLGKYGFKFGISSRGEGDLITDFSGEESVDPDTYTLNAFDLVLIPACEDARLQFNESLNTKKSNKLRTILSEALNNASDKDRRIMEEALDELDIDDNWRFVETYHDEDIYFDPESKKYIIGYSDNHTVLNSLKNAKEYIDRYGVFDESYIPSAKDDEDDGIIYLEYIYDTYNDSTDRADHNLRGHINVRANSEEEAIKKAEEYLNHHDHGEYNIRYFQTTKDRYINVPLVEEQIGREETKYSEQPSDLLQNKPENEIVKSQEPEVIVINDSDNKDEESLDEALTPQEKMDAWHNGERRENIKACGDRKLATYMNICKNSGYDNEVGIIRQEFERRGIPSELYENIENREDDEPKRASWDTDFHRLDVAYNHNFKQFKDMEANSGMIRDFVDDLEAQGKDYDIYEHKSDPGCTIFFKESLNEDYGDSYSNTYDSFDDFFNDYNVPDNWADGRLTVIDVVPEGHSYEIILSADDWPYDSSELDKYVRDYYESNYGITPESYRVEVSVWDDEDELNESLNEDALDDSGVSIAPVHVIANMRSKDKFNLENGNLIQGKDLLDYFDPYDKLKIANSPGEIDKIVDVITESLNEDISWEELNGTEQSAVEMALAAISHGSTLEDAVHGAVEDCNWGNVEPEYEDEDFFGEEANYTKVLDYVKNNAKLNEGKYTRDELFDKFGTDNLDIINAGNEEEVELAADDNGAIVEQLQNILKQNKSLEEKIKVLQEKLSVGYAKEMELKEELDTYKQKVSKLSEKTKEIKVLTEKLSKAEKLIKNNKAQAEGKISTLNESISNKDFENKDLRKDISVLTETLGKKDSLIKSLDEQLGKYKEKLSSKQDDIEQLKEQYETGQKDLEQLKTQYAKKIEQQNQIIEKYQRVAKNSVKRYIESQAVRLGVKSDEIVNRLPKNYSFNDIDTICEDLQEYKFNMSNLPFGQYGLNENLKVAAKNVKQDLIEANPDDEITEYDLKIAEAYI